MSTPPFGNWPPINPGGTPTPPGSSTAFVLTTDSTFWLDADNGNDAHDGKTLATAWKSFAPWNTFLETYVEIDNAVATLNIVPSVTIPTFVGVEIPTLRNAAKVVLRGTQDDPMLDKFSGLPLSFVAAAGSTTSVINVAAWNGSNPVGYQIVCTAGANIGARRHVQSWTGTTEGGAPATLVPTAVWDHPPTGDTFGIVHPKSQLSWPTGVMSGAGRTMVTDLTNDPGIYLSQLKLIGTPSLLLTTTIILGCEYLANTANPGGGVQIGDQTFTSLGVVLGAMPWIDANAGLWNGLGLASIFEAQDAGTSDLFYASGTAAFVNGYWVGSDVIFDTGSQGFMAGGAVWGQQNVASTQASVEVKTGAVVTLAKSASAIAAEISSQRVNAVGVIACHDQDSVISVGFVSFTATSVPTLLRAYDFGTIDCTNLFGAASGTSTQKDAQDATGQGTITWDYLPPLLATIGAQLRVDGATALNSALTAVPSVFRDNATGLSRISRRSTTTPVASAPAPQTRVPFTVTTINYVVPSNMNVISVVGRPGAGGGAGGGGGGGGGSAVNGGGGAGGAGAPGGSCALHTFELFVAAGTALDITVGVGGAGGAGGPGGAAGVAGTSGTNGSQGGASIIALHGGATLLELLPAGTNSTATNGNGGVAGTGGSAGTTTGGTRGNSSTSWNWPNGTLNNGGQSAGLSGAGGLATAGANGAVGAIATGAPLAYGTSLATIGIAGTGGTSDGTRGGGGGATCGTGSAPGDEYVSALGIAVPAATGAGSGMGATPGGNGGAGLAGTGGAGTDGGTTTAAQTGTLGRGGGGGAGGGGGGAGSVTGGAGGNGSAGAKGSDGAWILILAPA